MLSATILASRSGFAIKVRAVVSRWLVIGGLIVSGVLAGVSGVHPAQAASFVVNSLSDSGGSCPGATCTLRDAITAANTAGGTNTISFNVSGTITLGSSLPAVASGTTLTIDGAGQTITISGNNAYEILLVNGTATLNNLTLTDGYNSSTGGALYSDGILTLNDDTLSNNQAQYGGAILNVGPLTINSSTFASNSSNGVPGTAGSGGALYLESGDDVLISNSTFYGNQTLNGANGGNIDLEAGNLTIANSTVTGNSDNVAHSSGGVFVPGTGETLNFFSDIIYGNTASGNPVGADVALIRGASDTSYGYNFIGTADGTYTATGDHVGVDPLLATLANNGGLTQTVALENGSPALHAGACGGVTVATGINAPAVGTDQRGTTRGNPCDSGAFEGSVMATPTITNTATDTATFTPSHTATATPSDTATSTPSHTATVTPSHTSTVTPSDTASATNTNTLTPSNTATATATVTNTASITDTPTPTDTATLTPSLTATPTDTATLTPSLTATPTNTATLTPSLTASLTATNTASITNTATLTPSLTASLTATNTASATNTATLTPSLTTTPTNTATLTPSLTATPTNTTTFTPSATLTPSRTLTPTITASATSTASVTASVTNTLTATATMTSTMPSGKIDTIGIDRSNTFSLRLHNSAGVGDITVTFNVVGRNVPIVGDWTGQGFDAIGVLDQNTGNFTLCTSNTTSVCASSANQILLSFTFGNPNDTPLSGRWIRGATSDGIGVYRPSNGILYTKNTLSTGAADDTLVLGNPGDQGIAGDWTGIGQDGIGVYRPSNLNFYLVNQVANGIVYSNINFQYGGSSDVAIAGDWIAQGHDGVGVFRPSNATVYLKNALTTGNSDNAFLYGAGTDIPIAGHWQVTYPPIAPSPALHPTLQPGSISVPGGNQIGG